MLIGGSAESIPLPMSECVVPEGINGPVAIWVTSDGQPLINNVRDRATTQIVAGPALAFIDTQPQMLGQLARGSGSGSQAQGTSTTTRTISPAEASAVVASAGAEAPAPTSTDGSGSASAQSGSVSQINTSSANLFTGKSPDGKITVNGWTGI